MTDAVRGRASSCAMIAALVTIAMLAAIDEVRSARVRGEEAGTSNAAPPWLADHMRFLVGEKGWATSNAAYRDEATEPLDAYTMTYEWGIGKHSVRGRLSGRRADRDAGTFWEIHLVWDPVERKERLFQFSADGTVAEGTIAPLSTGTYRAELALHMPDGNTMTIRDEITEAGPDEMRSRSFHAEGDNWLPKRHYSWRRSR